MLDDVPSAPAAVWLRFLLSGQHLSQGRTLSPLSSLELLERSYLSCLAPLLQRCVRNVGEEGHSCDFIAARCEIEEFQICMATRVVADLQSAPVGNAVDERGCRINGHDKAVAE